MLVLIVHVVVYANPGVGGKSLKRGVPPTPQMKPHVHTYDPWDSKHEEVPEVVTKSRHSDGIKLPLEQLPSAKVS